MNTNTSKRIAQATGTFSKHLTDAAGVSNGEAAAIKTIAVYRQIQEAMKALEEVKAQAAAQLAGVMDEMNMTELETVAGWAYITPDTTFRTYNGEGLDAAAEADAELAAKIAPFRRVTNRKGSITVKAQKPAKKGA